MQLDDQRFESMKSKVPWGSVGLAVGLMLFGLSSFVVAWLHVTQQVLGKEQAVRKWEASMLLNANLSNDVILFAVERRR